MYHYVFRTEEGKRYYIGVRSSKLPPEIDPYIGSGMSVLYGIHYIRRVKIVLGVFPTRREAEIEESRLIREHYVNPFCMNRRRTNPKNYRRVQ